MNISRQEKMMTKVMTGRLKVNPYVAVHNIALFDVKGSLAFLIFVIFVWCPLSNPQKICIQ